MPIRPKTRIGKATCCAVVSLVLMDTTLHGSDCNISGVADDEAAGVSDGGGLRERWDLGVGDMRCVGKGIGEGPESRAENESDVSGEALCVTG